MMRRVAKRHPSPDRVAMRDGAALELQCLPAGRARAVTTMAMGSNASLTRLSDVAEPPPGAVQRLTHAGIGPRPNMARLDSGARKIRGGGHRIETCVVPPNCLICQYGTGRSRPPVRGTRRLPAVIARHGAKTGSAAVAKRAWQCPAVRLKLVSRSTF